MAKADKAERISCSEMARRLGVTRQAVSLAAANGRIAKGEDGKYAWPEAGRIFTDGRIKEPWATSRSLIEEGLKEAPRKKSPARKARAGKKAGPRHGKAKEKTEEKAVEEIPRPIAVRASRKLSARSLDMQDPPKPHMEEIESLDIPPAIDPSDLEGIDLTADIEQMLADNSDCTIDGELSYSLFKKKSEAIRQNIAARKDLNLLLKKSLVQDMMSRILSSLLGQADNLPDRLLGTVSAVCHKAFGDTAPQSFEPDLLKALNSAIRGYREACAKEISSIPSIIGKLDNKKAVRS